MARSKYVYVLMYCPCEEDSVWEPVMAYTVKHELVWRWYKDCFSDINFQVLRFGDGVPGNCGTDITEKIVKESNQLKKLEEGEPC